MRNFRRDNGFGGKRNGGGFSDRNSGGPTTMHHAVCSQCGKDCEVPFKPTGEKPVYCSDCFRSKRDSDSRGDSRGSGGQDFGRSNRFSDKKMYSAVCGKCGNNCEVPFMPTNSRPVYCSNCFDKNDKREGSSQDNKQLDIIHSKLDKILKLLNPNAVEEKVIEKPKAKVEKIEKVEIKEEKKEAKKEDKKEDKKPKTEKTPAVKKEKAKKKK